MAGVLQSKIIRYTERENKTHKQEDKKSLSADPEMTEIMEC